MQKFCSGELPNAVVSGRMKIRSGGIVVVSGVDGSQVASNREYILELEYLIATVVLAEYNHLIS
jgi:hypothetical protein